MQKKYYLILFVNNYLSMLVTQAGNMKHFALFI